MRRIANILLLLMLATLLPAQNRVKPEGTGTANDPYKIGNMGHLLWFSDSCNKEGGNRMCAILTADIVVDEAYNADTVMLGRDVIYAGTFDGKGHSITGLNTKGNVMTPGFIGSLSSNGVVKNLIIRDSRFMGNGGNVGAICGLSGGKIINCAVLHCSVTAKNKAGEANGTAGGICGSTTDPGVIEGCYCYNPEDSVYGENHKTGAIVGVNVGAVMRCFASRMKGGDVYLVGRNDERGYLAYNEGNITNVRFASGEITYRMNDGNKWNAVMPWTQRINVEEGDPLPTFNSSDVWGVYKSQSSTEEVLMGKYTTRWYPVDFDMEGLTAYTVTELRDDTVRLQEYNGPEWKFVPLILYAKEDTGSITVPAISYFFNEDQAPTFSEGLLKPELKGRIIVSNESETNYVLQTPDSIQAFYRVSTDSARAIPGADSRCYLSIPTGQYDARAASLAISTEDATGVVALTGQTAEDEQDCYVYNMRGERLRTGQMRQGEIYIRNRRRVLKR